jgi:chromate reductase, NAD(P)H dehydrogenase (quinone)
MAKILAIPGSLRPNSSSNQVLNNIASMVPANISFEIYDGVGTLPHFNDAESAPEAVLDFRNKIREADAVLICTPEYAFGVPGSLKNAIDWTVGSSEFVDKPVGLITASSQGDRGHAAMLLILEAISAKIVDESVLLIPFIRAKLDPQGNIKDTGLVASLQHFVNALSQHALIEK